jgi:hypothetical protein
MDPMEINFKYGDAGGAKAMFESPNQSKLSASKDKGLKPLLEFLAHHINQHLIWPLDEDFQFEFVGLEANSQSEQADLNTKLVKSVRTVNELRAEDDLPPLPDGDVILDPVFAQMVGQRKQAEQMAQQQAAGGFPGAEGGPPGDGDDEGSPDSGNGGGQDEFPFTPKNPFAPKNPFVGGKPGKPFPPTDDTEKSLRREPIVIDLEV